MLQALDTTSQSTNEYVSLGDNTAGFALDPISVPASADLEMVYWVHITGWSGGNPGVYRAGANSDGNSFFIFQGTTGLPWIRWNGTDILKPASGSAITEDVWQQHRWRVFSGSSCDFSVRSDACDEWDVLHSAAHTRATAAHTIYHLTKQFGGEAVLAQWHQWEIYINGTLDSFWQMGETREAGEQYPNSVEGGPDLVLRLSTTSESPITPTPTNLTCDLVSAEPFALRHNPRTNKVIPVLSAPTVTDIGANCVRPRVTKGY